MRARLSICALVACGLIAAPSAAAAGCPNEALREAQGATELPGCMALEMVSPPKKFSEPAFSPSFSFDGERALYAAQAPLAGTPGYQFYSGDRYVAGRTAAGWHSAATSPPLPEIVAGGRHGGGPSAFNVDLSRWVQLGATQVEEFNGVFRLYRGGLDGSLEPLSPLMVPIDNSGGKAIQFSVSQIDVSASSGALETTVLRSRITSNSISYLPGDPKPPPGEQADVPGGDRNSYVAFLRDGEPALELLARDKDGLVYGGRCGAHLGGANATINQGAMSASGQRIFFSTRPAQPFDPETGEGPECDTDNPIRILVRTATEAGPEIAPLLPGGLSEWEQPGDDNFEAASADGTRTYIATPRKLTGSDTDPGAQPCSGNLGSSEGCDLYLYDSGKAPGARLTLVSDGAGPGQSADVLSPITAVSGDGSRAYFVAQGVLTPDTNPEGVSAVLSAPNLYVYDADADQIAFVGTLAEGEREALWGIGGSFFGDAYAAPLYGPGGPQEETGGDGHVLAFASEAALTSDDTDGGRRDVFRYDATADSIERISKAAPGGSDNGPFDVSVNPNLGKEPESNFGEQSRWVSEDGQSIAFATQEALLPGDSAELNKPYVWREGQLGGLGAEIEVPPAVAADGEQIAFGTREALLPQDKDTAEDVYVARDEGGFSFPVQAGPPCDPLAEGGCQGLATSPPPPVPDPTADTRGNVVQPVKCRKGFVKRKGRCAKKPRRAKGKKKADRVERAGR